MLSLSGRLDFHARQVFHHAMEKARFTQSNHIILNFSHVPFVDSAGLGLLMLAHKSLGEANSPLSLEVSEGYGLQVLT